MKLFGLLLPVTALALALGAAPADAATDYKVLCAQMTVQGGAVGPEVCVPLPVEP